MPKPPADSKTAGKALWAAVVDEYELEEHELALLREVVRTVNVLDDLAAIVAREGAVLRGSDGSPRVHPALVQARASRITLARLQAALRLPAGEKSDQAEGRRPQRWVGVRGVYSRGFDVRRRRRPPEVVPPAAPVEFPAEEPMPERLLRFDPEEWRVPGRGYAAAWIGWSNARVAWANRPGHWGDFGQPNESHTFVMAEPAKWCTPDLKDRP